jgi:uncharacterized protein
MSKTTPLSSSRIVIVDALRGSALFGILLLHCIEHWDFSRYPDSAPDWMRMLDQNTHDIGFFLFGGKAYAIFAMMFGLSFYLILSRWSTHGINFPGRFLWRLGVLALLGYVHGIIYCGDILLIIAVLGAPLLLVHRLGNRALLWISLGLMLQLPSLWQAGHVLLHPGFAPSQPRCWAIYGRLGDVYSQGSFLDVCTTNLWLGQSSRILWTIETGRYLQMMGLFVWGLLLGRSRVFEDPVRCRRLGWRALLWGSIGFAVLSLTRACLAGAGLKDLRLYYVENLVGSYGNLAQMAVWVGGFVLLYHYAAPRRLLSLLAPYGRMSLTCYVTQALVGVPLFYGYGFALYRYMGPFTSVLFGIAYFALQCACAHFWLRRFIYGPLEWFWRSCTFLTFATPMRRPVARREDAAVGQPAEGAGTL